MARGTDTSRVAANIKGAREGQGLDLKGLSARLDKMGHGISYSSLSRIENGTRRVDVDDLVHLALALRTTPNRLLIGPSADGRDAVTIGPVETTALRAWQWVNGDARLLEDPTESAAAYRARVRPDAPHVGHRLPPGDVLHSDAFAQFGDALRALRDAGVEDLQGALVAWELWQGAEDAQANPDRDTSGPAEYIVTRPDGTTEHVKEEQA